MALLEFWRSARKEVLGLNVQQVLNIAGSGQLRDDGECSLEFRKYLSEVPSEHLGKYVQQCLDASFPQSGLVLQDVVNEIGRRLDFEVEHGLYLGRKNAIGHDGLWRSDGAVEIVIEVKTATHITVDLDKVAGYRTKLVAEGKIAPAASVLIVIGREDTGPLEAQIRGSRHAWDMRMIGAESLLKLLRVKERFEDEATVTLVKQLLRPVEYTKIDKIVDVVFAATKDTEKRIEEIDDVAPRADGVAAGARSSSASDDADEIEVVRGRAVAGLGDKLGKSLVRFRRTLFWDQARQTRACVAVSKAYKSASQGYWYAFHPTWHDFLSDGAEAYFVLACLDLDHAFAIPFADLKENLSALNTSQRPNGQTYWHINVLRDKQKGLLMRLPRSRNQMSLKPFRFSLTS